jgi:hypothetical protein
LGKTDTDIHGTLQKRGSFPLKNRAVGSPCYTEFFGLSLSVFPGTLESESPDNLSSEERKNKTAIEGGECGVPQKTLGRGDRRSTIAHKNGGIPAQGLLGKKTEWNKPSRCYTIRAVCVRGIDRLRIAIRNDILESSLRRSRRDGK